MNETNTAISDLGPLQRYSDAAARMLGHEPGRWAGFEFSGVKEKGIWVSGRKGKRGKIETIFVPNEDVA